MKKIIPQSEIVKIAALGVALLLVVILLDWPIFNKIKKFAAALQTEVSSLELENQQGNNYTKATLDWQQADDQLPALSELVKPAGGELDLIKQLEKLAAENNLEQELTLSQTSQNWSEKIEVLGLSAQLVGQFNDLLAYLERIEKLNFQLTVDSVAVKPAKSETTSGQVFAQLILNTYWLKNNEENNN